MIVKMRKIGIIFSILMLTLLLLVSGGAAQEIGANANLEKGDSSFEPASVVKVNLGTVLEPKGVGDEPAIYLIRLADAPLATYGGEVNGFAATSPQVTGEHKLNTESMASQSYQKYLLSKQDWFAARMKRTLGRDIEILYQFVAGNNGIAARLTSPEAAQIAALPGVTFVQRDEQRELHTDAGPAWIGAPGIWEGTATGGLPGTKGEGIVVGVIDTGINPSNPSFAVSGPIDGYVHTNPKGKYFGVCDPAEAIYDPSFPCNDKLIGAWGFPNVNGGDPRDYDGHGSHTASTAAGNEVAAAVSAPTLTINRTISGVAPHANIIAYAGCCSLSALTAAIDQAILDGVDVINYSIGSSSPSDPWVTFDSVGFLNARAAGIFVATSAGNDGPDEATVGSPGDAPWLTAVAAATHNRKYINQLVDLSGGDTTPPAILTGKGFTSGYGPAPILYAGDLEDQYPGASLCGTGPAIDPPDGSSNPFPPGTFNGEIVVCDRGVYGRIEKGLNVMLAGAGGYVLANAAANGDSLVGDPHFLPAVHITYHDGVVLKDWLAAGAGHMATIAGAAADINPANGDIMADFSSRGPNRALPDMLSPHVAAPGVDIIAAAGIGDAVEWNFNSGTSMASPHVAGAGALLMALHPDWTPAEVQSALMTTAVTAVFKEDGLTAADPFDMGSGRVDLTQAGRAGLVLDETEANYWAADPAAGGSPRDLNTPYAGSANCVGICRWTRTVRNTLASEVTWTVSVDAPESMEITVTPAVFTLAAGGAQALLIEADVLDAPPDKWIFGRIILSADGGEAPDAHLPVAVVPTPSNLPDRVEIATRRDAGSDLMVGLEAAEISELTVGVAGLVPATMEALSLSQDPTRNDPYDNLNDGTTYYLTVSVPDDAARLVAKTFDSTAPDVDLFVGTGSIPSAATQVCASTSSTAVEYCNLDTPTAGEWWILVQNWAQSAAPPDDLTLAYAIVAGDAGNLRVEGPDSAPELTPFDLRLFWNEPAMEAEDLWYGAFNLRTDPGHPGNLGTVNVDLARHADDVTKRVSATTAVPGDTLTYTITIQPNVTNIDLAYTLTDTIPVGLTYVPGSATASDGAVAVAGDTLTWTGTMPTSPDEHAGSYALSTSDTDPSCDTGFGGYVNLEAFGILTQPAITGDTVGFTAFTSGDPINYFGVDYTGMSFTDDGFAIFDFGSSYGGSPWIPQAIPDAALPNNVLAAYWHDFEIFYDAALNHGVSLASSGAPGGKIVVEYDDIQLWGGSASQMDFEIVVARAVNNTPGAYEIVYAFDNVSATPGPTTIGVENAAGSDAAFLVSNSPGSAVKDGFMVCFDWTGGSLDPVEITYQVTVDSGAAGTLTNHVVHNTDNPGSVEVITSVDVVLPAEIYLTSNSDGLAGDVAYADEDIVVYNAGVGEWAMYFDGSDVGLKNTDIDGIQLMEDGSILLSLERRLTLPGLGKVDGSDIIRFIPTSLGQNTDGSFEWFFDGSDVGLKKNGENIDAFSLGSDGRLVISTLAAFKVPQTGGGNLRGDDDDLLIFNARSLGADTDGDWERYLDGSDLWHHTSDIWGAWLDPRSDDIYFSMQSEFTAGGIDGHRLDIFICYPITLGDDSACDFELYFGGAAAGFGGDRIDGLAIKK